MTGAKSAGEKASMKFAHTTLHVSDPERSAKFYEEVVGLREVRRIGEDIIFLADESSDTELELVRAKGEVSCTACVAIGFYCEKVGSYHQKLAEEGYDISNVIAPSPETHFFFVKDPDGHSVQFID